MKKKEKKKKKGRPFQEKKKIGKSIMQSFCNHKSPPELNTFMLLIYYLQFPVTMVRNYNLEQNTHINMKILNDAIREKGKCANKLKARRQGSYQDIAKEK